MIINARMLALALAALIRAAHATQQDYALAPGPATGGQPPGKDEH